jgi:hypothetical protein
MMRASPCSSWRHAWSALVLTLLLAAPARANRWGILPVEGQGLAPSDAETFRSLVQAELGSALGSNGQVILVADRCADTRCAAVAAQKAGADLAVLITVGGLGQKLVTTGIVVDAESGDTVRSERLTVDRVEDLEAAATRLASAFASGKRVDATAELGAITEKEAKPAIRRQGDSGLSARVGGMVPFGGGLADLGVGMAFDLGFWYEAPAFSIEPRVGFRFDTNTRDDQAFYVVPIDLSAQYILGLGDFTPYFGGGMGARWTFERRQATFVSGGDIQTTHEAMLEEDGWGFGIFARAGLLLFRTYSVRMMLDFSYDVTFVELNGAAFPQTFQFGLGVVF